MEQQLSMICTCKIWQMKRPKALNKTLIDPGASSMHLATLVGLKVWLLLDVMFHTPNLPKTSKSRVVLRSTLVFRVAERTFRSHPRIGKYVYHPRGYQTTLICRPCRGSIEPQPAGICNHMFTPADVPGCSPRRLQAHA